MRRDTLKSFPSAIWVGTLILLNLKPVVGHVYIKSWKSTSEDNFQLAQKQPASKTAYRDGSTNIGWIGSHFLAGDRAIVCGASNTPFAKVASPGGNYFSDASESAGQTMTVEAGGKVTLITAGDAGKGYPHPNGHIQTYLGYCGESKTACQKFDAATANYFKIQEVKNGVQDKLLPAMNYKLDGNVWEVPIPSEVPQGSYIFRFEIITFGQSDEAEGLQDQYYPSCGQLYVKSDRKTNSLSSFPTVKFPGAYKDGNIQKASAPGPQVIQERDAYASKATTTSKATLAATSNNIDSNSVSSQNSTSSKSQPAEDADSEKSTGTESQESSSICLPNLIPSCAKMCLAKKHEEAGTLAAGCATTDGKCLCSRTSFVQAYKNCVKDHCAVGTELSTAVSAFTSRCERLTKKRDLSSAKLSLRRHRRHRRQSFSSTSSLNTPESR